MNPHPPQESWKEKYRKAALRHFSQNTGEFPEIDGIVWVASEDVQQLIPQLIAEALTTERKRISDALEGEKRYGEHEFPIGGNRCIYCSIPNIIIDRKRVVLRKDEKSGGELAEVTENRIDNRGQYCDKNPFVGRNVALSRAIDITNQSTGE